MTRISSGRAVIRAACGWCREEGNSACIGLIFVRCDVCGMTSCTSDGFSLMRGQDGEDVDLCDTCRPWAAELRCAVPDGEPILMRQTRRLGLSGTTTDFAAEDIDADQLTAPLGLSGIYTVLGIDCAPDKAPAWSDDRRAWWARLRQAQAFDVTCTPNMTAIHLMRLAALEHKRRNDSVRGGHIFFERLTIVDRVIEFSMGS